MTRIRGYVIAVALSALAVFPAAAGGPTTMTAEQPVVSAPAVAVDWQGLHFGIAAQRPSGDNFWAERSIPVASAAGNWAGTTPSLSLGYDLQRGKMVYGMVLSISSGDFQAIPTTGGGFGCGGCETSVEKLTTLRGRVGLSLGKTLVYASAGLARANATGTSVSGTFVTGKDSLSGWTAGVGVERFVGSKITVSAEYLQTDLGRLELPLSCGSQCYTDISFGAVQLGINYRW